MQRKDIRVEKLRDLWLEGDIWKQRVCGRGHTLRREIKKSLSAMLHRPLCQTRAGVKDDALLWPFWKSQGLTSLGAQHRPCTVATMQVSLPFVLTPGARTPNQHPQSERWWSPFAFRTLMANLGSKLPALEMCGRALGSNRPTLSSLEGSGDMARQDWRKELMSARPDSARSANVSQVGPKGPAAHRS